MRILQHHDDARPGEIFVRHCIPRTGYPGREHWRVQGRLINPDWLSPVHDSGHVFSSEAEAVAYATEAELLRAGR